MLCTPTSSPRRSFLLAGLASLSDLVPSPMTASGSAYAAESWTTFTRDLSACYQAQFVALDFDDVNTVVSAARDPRIGVGMASGPSAAAKAARAALAEVQGSTMCAVITVATAPAEGHLQAYKTAFNTVLENAGHDAYVIYGACEDPLLEAGSVRVCVLRG